MDCTPDMSHIEQLSMIIRIVVCELGHGISVFEHFVGFIEVHDTSGSGLFNALISHIEKLGIDIANCRGPGPLRDQIGPWGNF